MILDASEGGGDLDLACDAVVVGSGAGGAVVAAELAEAGQEVVILEEGAHHPPEVYGRMRPSEHMRHLWREGGMTFALGVGDSPLINVTMGRALGGSSLLTGGVCFRVPEQVLAVWHREHRLPEMTPKAMEPYFEEVERICHVETVPESMRSRSTVLFGEGLARLGHRLKPIRRNTRGCQGASRCNFGCPHGAKLSVDLTFLPRAYAAGARAYTRCLVERVTHRGGHVSGVKGRILGADGRSRGRLSVRARRVVLAAGAYHTPLILLRSGVGRASGQVGRNLTLHPAFRVMAVFDERVEGWRGALQSAYSDAFEGDRFTLMSLFVPPGVLAATQKGIGPDHHLRARQIPHMTIFGGLIHDEGGGRVRRGLGREPLVTYRMSSKDRAAVPKIMRTMARIWFEAGAREVVLPILGLPPVGPDDLQRIDLEHVPMKRYECASQHPLGSCRMGAEAQRSVVDPNGRAWDLEELWIADGSVIPTSLGVNPQLTIMSMALRIARKMIEQPLPRTA